MNRYRLSLLLALLLPACAAPPRETATTRYTTPTPNDTARAAALNADGLAKLSAGDGKAAERLFREALSADPDHAPAHNNLGKLYFRRGDLYQAAWEFEYAARLLPSNPEPRNNLGLVRESANQLDEAVSQYTQAAALAPDNAEVLGNLARARLRRGDATSDVRPLLVKLLEVDTRPEWVEWARQRLATAAPERTAP